MSGGHDDTGKPSSAKMTMMKELLHRSENHICADCSALDPKWDDTQFPISSLRVGTVEFIGILNVKVIGGTKLAQGYVKQRPLCRLDPWPTVIKGNLNPVWNEELKLCSSAIRASEAASVPP